MGICMSKKGPKKGGNVSRSKRTSLSKRGEELLQKQALAMVIQQHIPPTFDNGCVSCPRGSTSSRPRPATSSDRFSNANSKPLPEFLENMKTKKFVLVHGEGFGAWCWYKTIALLEESGVVPIALDLAGCGINTTDKQNVTTLEAYSKPLLDFLQNLPQDEKVILVGHSSGGACISYALEHLPEKISKAVYICATMVSDGQRPFDVFTQEPDHLFSSHSNSLIYGNGKDNPPTEFMFQKHHLQALYFNQSPTKDVALAMVSMRPIPLGPMMENLSLSTQKYGKARRFYVQTLDDNALSPHIQESLLRVNPPEGVLKIKGSDHCPFFSKPQSLHRILLEIAQIP